MIYFLKAAGVGLVKIGFTAESSADRRVTQLRTMSPIPLSLLGTIPGSQSDEMAIHQRFAHLGSHGEWFWPTKELEEFIRQQIEAPPEEPEPAPFLLDVGPRRKSGYRKNRPDLKPKVELVKCSSALKQWALGLAEERGTTIPRMVNDGLTELAERHDLECFAEVQDCPPESVHPSGYPAENTIPILVDCYARSEIKRVLDRLDLSFHCTVRLAIAMFARSIGVSGCPLTGADVDLAAELL